VTADFDTDASGHPVVTVALTFVPIPLVPLVPIPDEITREAQFDVEYLPPEGITDSGAVECSS